jgi:hypothetical protein
MKKTGILFTVGGFIVLVFSVWDLFYKKNLPVPLTVAGLILGVVFTFSGPAFAVFDQSLQKRKRVSVISLIISLLLIALGVFGKYLHLPGANVEILLGGLIMSFFYGTLTFKNKYEKWRSYTRSNRDAFFLSLFDFLGLGLLALGLMFKILRWPLADIMTIIGMSVFAVGVFAWNQKFKKEVIFRKETEDKLKVSLDEIEAQHKTLEEKQKEIIDSITYARRIQSSLLPTEKYIQNNIERLKREDHLS